MKSISQTLVNKPEEMADENHATELAGASPRLEAGVPE